MTVVESKVRADCGDQVRIVPAILVNFEIKVEPVDKHVAKGLLYSGIARVAIRIPQVLTNLLSLGLRLEQIRPAAPPRNRMILTPALWHVAMDDAIASQFWSSPEVLMEQDCPIMPDSMLLPLL